MVSFKLKLAGVTAEVRAQFPTTKIFCKDYLSEEPASFAVTVTEQDIRFEREKSYREAVLEGIPARTFPDPYLETLALYRKLAVGLLPFDVLLAHGSAVAVDGKGYLFSAKSGVGKSTHTRLWRAQFGARAVMVNDDKPLLRFTPGGVLVCGTPWNGKHCLSSNIEVPLAGFCLLERAEENRITPVAGRAVYPQVLQQIYRPEEPALLLKTLALLDRLTAEVPLYRLQCNKNPEAALVAYYEMNKKENAE